MPNAVPGRSVRQGLKIETEATIRARKPAELNLPMRRVVAAVAALSLLIALVYTVKMLWPKRTAVRSPAQTQAAGPAAALPKADFEPYYQPKTKPAPEVLEAPAGKQ